MADLHSQCDYMFELSLPQSTSFYWIFGVCQHSELMMTYARRELIPNAIIYFPYELKPKLHSHVMDSSHALHELVCL